MTLPNNCTGHEIPKLAASKTVILSMGELAERWGYANTTQFRKTVLLSGRYPFMNLSRQRVEMRITDIPEKKSSII